MAPRLAVIGAGPIGLAAALAGRERGWDVAVLEREDVGHSLLRWGPTRLFSPLCMNVPLSVGRVLGGALPPEDALLSGPEMVEKVLRPLAASPALRGCIHAHHQVTSVGRAGMTKQDLAGHPIRAERPFRLQADSREGEKTFEADLVFDASGATSQPCWMGSGGLPARGERAQGERIIRHLGTLDERSDQLAGKRVLVIGSGHSAATAVRALAELARLAPATALTWAVRTGNRRPCVEVADDPLPERKRIAAGANDLAEGPPAFLKVERRASVEALEPAPDGALRVLFTGGRQGVFDEIVSLTGYRPDLSFLSELTLELSPFTEGAGRMSRALGSSTDCLSVPNLAPEDFLSGEPGFFLVGAKSYGRSRGFLLKTGLAQLETILGMVS